MAKLLQPAFLGLGRILGGDTVAEELEREALDIFGRMLMEVRDDTITQWDQLILGAGRRYPPWQRLLETTTDLNESHFDLLRKVLPHVVDTVLYCLLAALDWKQNIHISVETPNGI